MNVAVVVLSIKPNMPIEDIVLLVWRQTFKMFNATTVNIGLSAKTSAFQLLQSAC